MFKKFKQIFPLLIGTFYSKIREWMIAFLLAIFSCNFSYVPSLPILIVLAVSLLTHPLVPTSSGVLCADCSTIKRLPTYPHSKKARRSLQTFRRRLRFPFFIYEKIFYETDIERSVWVVYSLGKLGGFIYTAGNT